MKDNCWKAWWYKLGVMAGQNKLYYDMSFDWKLVPLDTYDDFKKGVESVWESKD